MAGIIKAVDRKEAGPPQPLRAYQFHDVGQSYLDRVRTEAAKIVADARQEAARIKQKATDEGREAAMQAAQATLRTRLDQQIGGVLSALDRAAKSIDESRRAWQLHWETHIVQLATGIAGRICRQELTRSPNITLAWVREALELAAGSGEIVLRLHPDDVAALGSQLEAITSRLTTLSPAKVVADESVSSGGCRVETEFGSLDQQVEAQLARISEELLA